MTRPTPHRLPPAQAAELRQRLRGLQPAQAEMMRKVMQLQAAGDTLMAGQWLLQLAREAPDHPEVRLWQGQRHAAAGDWPQAVAALAPAVAARPRDFRLCLLLGSAQGHSGDASAAQRSFEQAAATAASAKDWLALSIEADQQGLYDEALQAAHAALRLDPASPAARLQRSRCHKALGHAQAAADDCRWLIAAGRELARAWFALVDLKTVVLTETEQQQLAAAAQRTDASAADRILLDFAWGQALESAGDLPQALAVMQRANAAVRATLPWDTAGFAAQVLALMQAFAEPTPTPAQHPGGEVIFLAGLPRSGSTLVEQVLASHPAVEGASELPYLPQVIAAESQRRGQPLQAWATQATAADWTRLGRHYLDLSARWRRQRPICTDKLPDNWLLAGAVRAMLPDARIIICQRDPLETAWSCYKQLFGPGLAAYSYNFHSLAQVTAACEQMGQHFARLHPQRVRVQRYEDLVADRETQVRDLLAFCGLSFDSTCLDFQAAPRAIRTPSALQVRQPMRQASTPAARFGPLLDPLRDALDVARAPAAPHR